jgi:hypothetical protein
MNPQRGYQLGSGTHVATATLDFVF